MKKQRVIAAHRCSIRNQNMLMKDHVCGCFYCLKIYDPREIQDWIHNKGGKTARYPCCGIDSVIGESSGFPITEEFLKEMKDAWF